MHATSIELRQLIVDAYERGEGGHATIAKRFGKGVATARRLVKQWREKHDLSVTYERSGPVALVPAEELPELRDFVAAGRSDWTAEHLKDAWAAHKGITLSRSAMVRALKKAGLSTKKKASSLRSRSGRTSSRSARPSASSSAALTSPSADRSSSMRPV